MEQPVSRRAWLAALASGAGVAAAACQSPQTTIIDDPATGRVLQWEGSDLLILVSGVQPAYQLGDTVQANVLVNNQTTGLIQVRIRTKILGLGNQPVVQLEPATLSVDADGANGVDQDIVVQKTLDPGQYTFSVELPPWQLNGRQTGAGATLQASIQVTRGG